MAFFRCSSGGGGAPTLSQLLYNANKTLLGTITTYGGSYTATQDCVMFAYCVGTGSYSPWIEFDGVMSFWSEGSNGSKYILSLGFSNSVPTSYGVFVPAGTVVTTRNRSGETYDVRFYTLD